MHTDRLEVSIWSNYNLQRVTGNAFLAVDLCIQNSIAAIFKSLIFQSCNFQRFLHGVVGGVVVF